MATPKTGAISMSDFNTELRQTTATAQISMNDIRARTGYSGQAISFGNLRNAYSATITQAYFTQTVAKVTLGYYGFASAPPLGGTGTGGSIDDNLMAANAYLIRTASILSAGAPISNTTIDFSNNASSFQGVVANGYYASDVTKIVLGSNTFTGANISVSSNVGLIAIGHTMANSGTVTVMIQFA